MLHQVIVVDGVDGKHQPTVQHTDKIRNMKNINKGLGYLVVILFWLVVITLLSSCYTVHPNTCNNLQVTNCPCTE